MNQWLVKWPNGDIAVVGAHSKTKAEELVNGLVGSDSSGADWKELQDAAVFVKSGGDIKVLSTMLAGTT